MQRVRLSELNETVRAFLARVQNGETMIVEDDRGALQCGITPYVAASPAEKKQAMAAMERLWQKTDRAIAEVGVTEVDVDRVLQEDD